MKRVFSLIFAVLLGCGTLFLPALAAREGQEASAPARPLTVVEREVLLSSLYEADIASLRRAIDMRLISCEELTAYYLRRIDEYNDEYNCFITICDDAQEQAALRDRQLADGTAQGSLFGIPVVVKDNIHVAGYPTTNGRSKRGVPDSPENAHIVESLLAQGAVILGKTNMSTDAQDAAASRSAAVGETKNAYSTLLSPGGSSGGSAVAVSLNFAPAALGTDTNSSLRIPAALAGCVSLRATTGLIPREGVITLNKRRDIPGAITRSVEDQARMLDVLCGGNYTEALDADALEGMRIGILEELSYAQPSAPQRQEKNISAEVTAAFANAVEELRACGAEVVSVSMPEIFTLSERTMRQGGYTRMGELTDAFVSLLREQEIAAVIFPTYLSEPLRMGTDEDGIFWNVYEQVFLNNCRTLAPSAAVPEITVPIGQHSLGAGIGMEIAAAPLCEQLLLDIAYSYTLRYDHRAVPSGAPDLHAYADVGDLPLFIAAYERSLVPKTTQEVPDAPQDGQEETLPPAVQGAEAKAQRLVSAVLLAASFIAAAVRTLYRRSEAGVRKGERREAALK